MLDFTHDPTARSWVASANDPTTHFPLQNLPWGVADGRVVVAIGAHILDVRGALEAQLLPSIDCQIQQALRASRLNELLALGREPLRQLRHALFRMLQAGSPAESELKRHLKDQAEAALQLPVTVGDYTDFFTCFNHAYNCGTIFRREQPVSRNFRSMPIAYHGRASSVVVSGTSVVRPHGQFRDPGDAQTIRFGPSQRLDFELELGAIIGRGNSLGTPIHVDQAEEHIAGLCLLNDWSARDIQSWEAQPLGPFQAKNFMSSISPWIVTLDALEPYRVPAMPRRADDPPLQAYLAGRTPSGPTTFALHTEARLFTADMRRRGASPALLSQALFSRDGDWTFSQMVAHHTINGCNLSPGDLLGSGTISGPQRGEEGCLLELTRDGTEPVHLGSNECRAFLEEGDQVHLSAWCAREGYPIIGLGVCVGEVQPAIKLEL
ncbi:fumarylacetoacetase [bacterium BD-1]|nr:fumarylacetoacetase [Ottowia caeni]